MYRYLIWLLLLGFLLGGCEIPITNQGVNVDNGLKAKDLLVQVSDDRRFIPVDRVADRLINDDPSMVLVDVRSASEYTDFSLPGAINLPLEKFYEEGLPDSLDCSRFELVFYSSDDLVAEQAWLYARSLGCNNVYIVKNGLNAWFDLIITPEKPSALADDEAMKDYQNRIGAAEFFLGTSKALEAEPYLEKIIVQPQTKVKPKKKILVKPKKRKPAAQEEGC